jgi:hypothetical protein
MNPIVPLSTTDDEHCLPHHDATFPVAGSADERAAASRPLPAEQSRLLARAIARGLRALKAGAEPRRQAA